MESSVTTSMIMKTVSRRVPRADAALGAITVRATAKRPASRMMPASSRSTNRVRLFGKGIKDLDFGLCTLKEHSRLRLHVQSTKSKAQRPSSTFALFAQIVSDLLHVLPHFALLRWVAQQICGVERGH